MAVAREVLQEERTRSGHGLWKARGSKCKEISVKPVHSIPRIAGNMLGMRGGRWRISLPAGQALLSAWGLSRSWCDVRPRWKVARHAGLLFLPCQP